MSSRTTPGFVVSLVATALGGCGDALLPSDYVGPPAAALSAKVLGPAEIKDARRPRLSVEWLGSLAVENGRTLLGQALRFSRSDNLQNDWDIGLDRPVEAANLIMTHSPSPGQVRLAVAKMVYFDDLEEDGRLGWGCRGASCDLVKAISAEFVVFVDRPASCSTGAAGSNLVGGAARIANGFHYYRLSNGVPYEVDRNESMNFVLIDRAPVDSNPTTLLRNFAVHLLSIWKTPFDC